MGFLTEYENNSIEMDGKVYRLDLAYDTVLNIKRMYKEKLLSDAEILYHALNLLGLNENDIAKLSWDERAELLTKIFKEKVAGPKRPKVGKQQILYDFEYDGEYIFASFMKDYGINLIEQQGMLPWSQFVALFQGLSKDTKIKEVMRIRGMEIPTQTKTNGKEIQELMEAKIFYALPKEITNSINGKMGIDTLFSYLEREAT